MRTPLEEITERALKLSREEKLALANRLLSDDENASSEIEAAWEAEIIARIRAIDDGTAVGIPYEEIRSQVDDRK